MAETRFTIVKTMTSISKLDGLAARRWTIGKLASCIRKILNSGVLLGIGIALVFCSSCQDNSKAQNVAEQKPNNASTTSDSVDKPKVSIKVNRRYDDKGNMIGFDSTYSSYYSNIKGDTFRMDSLMKGFDSYFDRNRSSFFDNRFDNLFFNDSIRYPDFFHKDFFLKRYELNDAYMRGMMERMDSMKNQFFYEHSQKEKKSKDL
jgi:hypothetical protein